LADFSVTGTGYLDGQPGGRGGNGGDNGWMETVADPLPGGGDDSQGPPPLPPANEDLLKDSLKRIKGMLEGKEGCAKAIGAKSPSDATNRVSRVKIVFKDLGKFKGTSDANSVLTDMDKNSGPVAQWNPVIGFRGIYLNANVDWTNPNGTIAVDQNGSGVAYRLATGNAIQLEVPSMSAQQFMDLTVLHELAHAYKVNHPNSDHTAFEKNIWENCFK